MATLNDLFPGNTGRLEFMRVMLRLQRPDLKSFPRDDELPEELETRLREALDQVRKG